MADANDEGALFARASSYILKRLRSWWSAEKTLGRHWWSGPETSLSTLQVTVYDPEMSARQPVSPSARQEAP